jgi:hypothetical protein
MKHTKQTAGQIGGRATLAKYGRKYMQQIGTAGARSTWARYRLIPVGQSGWAMVRRDSGEIKTFINYIPGR